MSFPTAELRARADQLDGKAVVLTGVVVGDFTDRAGKVGLKVRAEKLEEAKESAPDAPPAKEGPRLVLQVGHWTSIESFALSPDGATLATCGDTTVRLWDLATGELLRVLPARDEFVLGAAFSPDGKWLVTVQRFGRVRLWDVETGKEIRSWKDADSSPAEPVVRVAGTADKPLVVVTGDDTRQASIWDSKTGNVVWGIDLDFAPVAKDVAVDPTGRYLAVLDANAAAAAGKGAVYDLTTGKKVLDWAAYAAVVFTGDGKVGWIFADQDGSIGVRKLDKNDAKDFLTPIFDKAGKDPVIALALSPDGKTLAARDAAGGVTVWALGEVGGKIAHRWPKASGAGTLAFTADGKFLLDLKPDSRDGVRLRNAATGEIARVVAEGAIQRIDSAEFSPDGRVFQVEASENKPSPRGVRRAWDLSKGTETTVDPFQSRVLSPDGKTLATAARTASGGAELRLSAADGGGAAKELVFSEVAGTSKTPQPMLLTFSPDGRRLALRIGPTALVLDVPSRKPLAEIRAPRRLRSG